MKDQATSEGQAGHGTHVEVHQGQKTSFLSRLWRAFSLRRNLRSLVFAPDSHERPVDGLRALSILWVIAIHTIWFLPVMLSLDDFRVEFDRYEKNGLIRWLHRGELGVDLFFVLSGYLIGTILMKEFCETGSLRIGLFYARRFMRLMPVYAFVLLLATLAGFPNAHTSWANLLYVNNFIPAKDQFLNWTWSLAIEEQFYLVFPLFLLGLYRLRAHRIALLFALLVLGVVIRAVVIYRHDFSLPIVMHFMFDEPRANHYLDALYVKPYTRYGALLAGVIVAYLLKHTQIRETLRRRPSLEAAILLGGLGCIALVASVPIYSEMPWPHGMDMAYLAASRTIFGVGAAGLLLAVLAGSSVARPVARLLSLRLWLPVAQLSYSAYLVHPVVVVGLYLAKKRSGPIGASIISMYARNVVFTLIISLILYLFIEKPLMNLRPRAAPEPDKKPEGDRVVNAL